MNLKVMQLKHAQIGEFWPSVAPGIKVLPLPPSRHIHTHTHFHHGITELGPDWNLITGILEEAKGLLFRQMLLKPPIEMCPASTSAYQPGLPQPLK